MNGRPSNVSRRLTVKQRLYAEARVRGANQTHAAREAGSSQPKQCGSRWERHAGVREYMARLRKAATALASVDGQPLAQPSQPTAQRVAHGSVDLRAIAELVEVLAVDTAVMRETGGARIVRRWSEGKDVERIHVKTEVDGAKACERLLRHYDAMGLRPWKPR